MALREMTEDERMREQKFLAAKIGPFVGRQMHDREIRKIEEICADHRQRARLRGLDMPPLAVVVMPRLGNIEIVPGDLDQSQIEVLIVNLARKWPMVTPADLGFAIKRAFPGYQHRIEAARKHHGWTGGESPAAP